VNPAASDDVWLRPITNETHLRRRAVHHGALKKWISPPDDPSKPWKLEVSGRLQSEVKSISADAIQKVELQKSNLIAAGKGVPSALKYCGILHSTVDAIRSIADFDGDVIYEPNEDPAHANIVIRDMGLGEVLTVTDILIAKLIFLEPQDVAKSAAFSACA
jgi:hypothetical protein